MGAPKAHGDARYGPRQLTSMGVRVHSAYAVSGSRCRLAPRRRRPRRSAAPQSLSGSEGRLLGRSPQPWPLAATACCRAHSIAVRLPTQTCASPAPLQRANRAWRTRGLGARRAPSSRYRRVPEAPCSRNIALTGACLCGEIVRAAPCPASKSFMNCWICSSNGAYCTPKTAPSDIRDIRGARHNGTRAEAATCVKPSASLH